MPRVRLFHWRPDEAEPVIEEITKAGFEVDYQPQFHGSFKKLADGNYHAIVIDLSRLPSHGRYLAVELRKRSTTKHVPIVFVEGDPVKTAKIRTELPDAAYVVRGKVGPALKKAQPLENPITVQATLFSYSTRAVAQKIGIKANTSVAVFNAPRDFPKLLGELPADVNFDYDATTVHPITLWFVHDPDEYLASLKVMRKLCAAKSRLWIIWPKAASKKGAESGVTGGLIRNSAIEVGLVDYKICSVNETWSGMVFALKKT